MDAKSGKYWNDDFLQGILQNVLFELSFVDDDGLLLFYSLIDLLIIIFAKLRTHTIHIMCSVGMFGLVQDLKSY
jgi:hypothetical protein